MYRTATDAVEWVADAYGQGQHIRSVRVDASGSKAASSSTARNPDRTHASAISNVLHVTARLLRHLFPMHGPQHLPRRGRHGNWRGTRDANQFATPGHLAPAPLEGQCEQKASSEAEVRARSMTERASRKVSARDTDQDRCRGAAPVAGSDSDVLKVRCSGRVCLPKRQTAASVEP